MPRPTPASCASGRPALAQSGECEKMNPRRRNRLVLVLIVLLFAAPLVAAFLLRAGDWRPARTVANGVLVEPPRDLTAVAVTLADGSRLAWRDAQDRKSTRL